MNIHSVSNICLELVIQCMQICDELCENTVTSKTIAMSNLDVVCKAHHKHLWESHFALVGTNKVQTLGYKLILGDRTSTRLNSSHRR